MTIPPLKDILTRVDEASGVPGGCREAGKCDPAEQIRFGYPGECDPDVNPVPVVKCAKPPPVSWRDGVLTPYLVMVINGFRGPSWDLINGKLKVFHLPRFTAWEFRTPLVVDTPGDTEIAGELDLCNIPNSGVQGLVNPIGIDVREEV